MSKYLLEVKYTLDGVRESRRRVAQPVSLQQQS
jgi:hypothetical protein